MEVLRAFGFEEKEVCPTCVLRFTVGMSGVSKRSFEVCVCVTKEVQALVGNDLRFRNTTTTAWLAYLDNGEWRGRLVLERGWCVCVWMI